MRTLKYPGEPQPRSQAARSAAFTDCVRTPAARQSRAHGHGAAELWAKEWRQRNGDRETFCLHSFASIPLPNPLRGLGFRFRLATTRLTGCGGRRREEHPSAETAQPGAIVLGGRRAVRWQVVARGLRVSRLRRVTAAVAFPTAAEGRAPVVFAASFQITRRLCSAAEPPPVFLLPPRSRRTARRRSQVSQRGRRAGEKVPPPTAPRLSSGTPSWEMQAGR